MTRETTYPLQRLAELRQRAVAERKQELAEAIRLVEDTTREVERLEEACQRKSIELREYRGRRQDSALRAEALQQQGRYAEKLEQQRELAQDRHRAACLCLQEHQGAMDVARGALAAAQAECNATDTHRDKWARQKRQREERRADDEVDDLLRAGRPTDHDENR